MTETKGDDVEGYLRVIRDKHLHLAKFSLVYVSTPDFKDAFQNSWEKAVARMIEVLVDKPAASTPRDPARINVLPGCHLAPGDLDELRAIIEDFGLKPSFLPDLAGSLDGHIPDDFTPTTIGGIGVDEIATMGQARLHHCHWRADAPCRGRSGKESRRVVQAVRAAVRAEANDEFMMAFSKISGRPVAGAAEIPAPARPVRRRHAGCAFPFRRPQACDRRRTRPVVRSLQHAARNGGAVTVAITTTQSPVLERVKTDEVLIGNLEDLENLARVEECDLLITHSHGRQAAERLRIPFYRAGFPMFDRFGAGHQLSVGYRGTRDLIFDIANLMIADSEQNRQPTPDTWRHVPESHRTVAN